MTMINRMKFKVTSRQSYNIQKILGFKPEEVTRPYLIISADGTLARSSSKEWFDTSIWPEVSAEVFIRQNGNVFLRDLPKRDGLYWVMMYEDEEWTIGDYCAKDKTFLLMGDRENYPACVFFEIDTTMVERKNVPMQG